MSDISYKALYRKFRPIIFSEVVGQEHITSTLKNQVKNDKVAHAYLFSGPRGTGKTSAAKILSRAVNCLNNKDGDPCNECEICKGILNGSIMDVFEIDAASNNSVDNIRNIRDEVIYAPSKTKYKVYIIDEVHMLSTGAFNALLKTLEEPPKHVIFILATTEPHKLLPTIISRCQRFDFKRIGVKDISRRLNKIVTEINRKVETKAIELISHICDGGMRDALSILDQSLSLGTEIVNHEDVLNIVGIVESSTLLEILKSVKDKDSTKAIEIINDVFNDGKDLNYFMVKMIEQYRNLLMVKSLNSTDNIVDLSSEDLSHLEELVDDYNVNEIINIINILSETLSRAKKTNFSKVLLEITMIQLCNKTNNNDSNVSDLYDRVSKIEQAIGNSKRNVVKSTIIKSQNSQKHVEIKGEEKETKKEVKQIENKNINNIEESAQFLAEKISKNWNHILDDMCKRGVTPVKVQFLNNISIKPLSQRTVIAHLEYKQDIYKKMLSDVKLIDELKLSVSNVIGRQINLKVNSQKIIEKEDCEIDNFRNLVEKQGMKNLVNEI